MAATEIVAEKKHKSVGPGGGGGGHLSLQKSVAVEEGRSMIRTMMVGGGRAGGGRHSRMKC